MDVEAHSAAREVRVGKLGTPCERMQAENFSACACAWACLAGLGGLPAPMYFWHFFMAASNCGEFGLMPSLEPNWIAPWPLGSGKFGTPFVRMQAANFSAFWRLPPPIDASNWPPPPPEDDAPGPPATGPAPDPAAPPPASGDWLLAAFELPMLATPGEEPPPPQPATSAATPTSAELTARA